MVKYFENLCGRRKLKKLCNYSKIRREKIKGHEKIANAKWYFYYDETENFGKFKVDTNKTSGFNKEPIESPFMLGGIWSKEEISNEIAKELISKFDMNIQAKDIKFKSIFKKKCSFDKLIRSKELDYILDWLEKYNVQLHFVEHHIMYDIINDLYNSLPGEKEPDEKAVFRKLLMTYSVKLSNLLVKYNYPFVDDQIAFWNELFLIIPFTQLMNKKIEPKSIEHLACLYEQDVIGRICDNLLLAVKIGSKVSAISTNEVGVLTEDLFICYQLPTIIFKNARHYFDNENVIKGIFAKSPVYINGKLNKNYCFVNVVDHKVLVSEEINAVYISDWIIGILQRIIDYLRYHGEETFYPLVKSFSNDEMKRFVRLCEIIRKSQEENPFAFVFFDNIIMKYRFEWLVNYEETIIKAKLYS